MLLLLLLNFNSVGVMPEPQGSKLTCLMATEVLTSYLPKPAGRHQARQASGRRQAVCDSQTRHRDSKLSSQLSSQLSQLSLASEMTQSSCISISTKEAEQQCSSDHHADSDTGYCSSSALSPSSFAPAQQEPSVSRSSSSLEPASPRPCLHPRHSRGEQPPQLHSPGRDQQHRDAGTKLIALKQMRHVSEGRAPKPEVKRVGGNKQHADHSAHSIAHRAHHADVSHQGTGFRQQHRAGHRRDESDLQCSQDSRRQFGASRHHAAAAAADVHKRRQAKQQHRVEQDFPSDREDAFLQHSSRHAHANTIPASESSSRSEQYSRRQQQASSRCSSELVAKLQHDVETPQKVKQRRKMPTRQGAAKGQDQSPPAALLVSAQPPWLEHGAAAVSDQTHLGSANEPYRHSHKQQLKHVEAVSNEGSGQREAALLTRATTAAHMTSSQCVFPAEAGLTGQFWHQEDKVNAECRETEAASGTATHSAHHADRRDKAVSPLTVDSPGVRAGLHGPALETPLPGVVMGAAGEASSAAALHSAAVAPAQQGVTPGPMQALLIALENMTNMGQQKLVALGQGQQPEPVAPTIAPATAPAPATATAPASGTTSTAASKTISAPNVMLNTLLLLACCCQLLTTDCILKCAHSACDILHGFARDE